MTYEHDVRGRAAVQAEVARLADEVTAEVVAAGRAVTHVAVKIRWATFFTRSRIAKLPEPTTDPAAVRHRAVVVLERFAAAGFDLDRPIRLLGVRVMLQMRVPSSGLVGIQYSDAVPYSG